MQKLKYLEIHNTDVNALIKINLTKSDSNFQFSQQLHSEVYRLNVKNGNLHGYNFFWKCQCCLVQICLENKVLTALGAFSMNFLFLYWQEQTNDEQNKYKVLIKKKFMSCEGENWNSWNSLNTSQQLEEEKREKNHFLTWRKLEVESMNIWEMWVVSSLPNLHLWRNNLHFS